MLGERRINCRTKKIPTLAAALLVCIVGAGFLAGGASAADAPAAVVKNPFEGKAEAVSEGRALFSERCSECHGDGEGGTGPDLMDERWIYGSSDADLFETVSFGRKGGMPAWASDLSKDERWKLITFIRSLHKK